MRKTLPVQILLVLFSLSAAGQTYLAGTARREITPREPAPMWGYGDRHDALSEGTLDPLYADALVLSDGKEKLAIVGLDLGRSPGERSLEKIRERLLREAGIRWSILGGSHTHHGPVLELTEEDGKGKGRFDAALRYYRQLEDAIVEAVLEANAKLEPVKLAAGAAELPGWNANRHTKLEPKPVDPVLAVLRVDRESGQPLAILVNWAAHPTTLPPSTLKFSADYAGSLKEIIRKESGAAAIFLQGAAGDLRTERRSMDTFAYGEALGREALRLARSLAPSSPPQTVEIRAREERFSFKPRIDLSNPLVAAAYEKAFFPELVRNYRDEYAQGVRPRLMAILLGTDVGAVAASGEFFSSHAVRLRERARLNTLFFFGYSNGYHQYFPTIEACAEGGYGADPPVAPAAAGAGEELMNRALLWLYQLRGKIRQ
jgi:phage tail protein X